MDWSNEPYVRLYIRDTTTWRMLNWEAQALFPSLMKHLDRAGRLDLDGVSPVDAVCAALPKWPAAVVEAGLASLQERRVIVVTDVAIIAPKFEPAQNTPRSDKARQAESRARRRDEALASPRDASSDPVTPAVDASRGVTPSHSPIADPVLPTLTKTCSSPAVAVSTDAIEPEPEAAKPSPPVAEPKPPPTPPEARPVLPPVAELNVEQALVEIQSRQLLIRARHTGSARERVSACMLNCRTAEAIANLDREIRVRGIDGVLEVLEWAWERIAKANWSGKQREEERKRIVFAFGGSATYWGSLVAERADELSRAEKTAARASPVAPEPVNVVAWSSEFDARVDEQLAALRRPVAT